MPRKKNQRTMVRWIVILVIFLILIWLGESIAERVLILVRGDRISDSREDSKKSKAELIDELENLRDENLLYLNRINILTEELNALTEREELVQNWNGYPNIQGEPARIFMKDPYRLYPSFLIDMGARHGVLKNQVVLGHSGVVGRISEVHPTFSRVTTIESPKLAFGAVVKRTRELGVLVGGRIDLSLTYLTMNSDIMLGDEIITSGTTDITPGGLHLGHVTKVIRREPEEELIVQVKSPEEIEKLTHVWVVLSSRSIPQDASLSEGD